MKSIIARPERAKERGKFLLKMLVGGGLIYWVLRGKMVDFTLLQSVLFNPLNLIISFLFLGFAAFVIAGRWFLLARAQQLSLSFKNVFELVMIGNFFNTFMPGAVGGDIIKAWYVARREPSRRTKAVFTVLLDRVIGLSIVLFFAAVTMLIYFEWVQQRPQLQMLSYVIWGICGAVAVFGMLFFGNALWEFKFVQGILAFFHRFRPISKIMDAAGLYRKNLRVVMLALILSSLNIGAIVFLYMIQGQAIEINMEMLKYFLVVPIGLTVFAIPLLPGGIGVGQVAFYTLFQWAGIGNPELGGTLCTLMQIYVMLFNCLGAVFYLRFKEKPLPSEIESLSSADTSTETA